MFIAHLFAGLFTELAVLLAVWINLVGVASQILEWKYRSSRKFVF